MDPTPRRGEVLAVALPLVVSTLASTVMIFIDRMFLRWYSQEADGGGHAGRHGRFHDHQPSVGVAPYVNAFVAQYEGAGRPRHIGPIVWQGIWMASSPRHCSCLRFRWPALFHRPTTAGMADLETIFTRC